MLTYAPSGAFVAAPTTSLPEAPGGEANWDYRFTWLRDTGLLIDTLFRLGYSGEAKAFLHFIVRQAQENDDEGSDPVGVLYGIRGGAAPQEEKLSHLRGYFDSQPVRTGNRAGNQLQLDTFAHILEAFSCFQHTGGKIDRPMRKSIDRSIDTLLRRWPEPENGVWESVERRLYTYGKVMAWNGLGTATELTKKRKGELEKVCEEIRAQVLADGVKMKNGRAFSRRPTRSRQSMPRACSLLRATFFRPISPAPRASESSAISERAPWFSQRKPARKWGGRVRAL